VIVAIAPFRLTHQAWLDLPRAKCTRRPKLECLQGGYIRGGTYRFQRRCTEGKPYVRVWPSDDEPAAYEVCSDEVFKHHLQ
jgi:hypothetical protein